MNIVLVIVFNADIAARTELQNYKLKKQKSCCYCVFLNHFLMLYALYEVNYFVKNLLGQNENTNQMRIKK